MITKKPKRVDVTYTDVTEIVYIPEYTCPACMVTFKIGRPQRHVTRFKCRCGQELIVNKHIFE